MARMNTVFLNDYLKKEKYIFQREEKEVTLDGLYHFCGAFGIDIRLGTLITWKYLEKQP